MIRVAAHAQREGGESVTQTKHHVSTCLRKQRSPSNVCLRFTVVCRDTAYEIVVKRNTQELSLFVPMQGG